MQRRVNDMPTSYTKAACILGNHESRRIANNTQLRRNEDNSISVVLHSTAIVTFEPWGVIRLDSKGYSTVTTKRRINACLPDGFHLYQRAYCWYLAASPPSEVPTQDQEFFDGMKIRPFLTERK
jgi:hypothetical protein